MRVCRCRVCEFVGMWRGCKLVLNTSSVKTERGRCGMMLYIVGSWNEKDGERVR